MITAMLLLQVIARVWYDYAVSVQIVQSAEGDEQKQRVQQQWRVQLYRQQWVQQQKQLGLRCWLWW
jgi:hypothetical protein